LTFDDLLGCGCAVGERVCPGGVLPPLLVGAGEALGLAEAERAGVVEGLPDGLERLERPERGVAARPPGTGDPSVREECEAPVAGPPA
jgi:hypothetical protein